MTQFIGFDIYGTLIDVQAISAPLLPHVGNDLKLAGRFSELWREKQLEYSFRRAAMRSYEPFPVCSEQALLYTATVLRVELSQTQRQQLLAAYQSLPAFAEVADGLLTLRARKHRLAAFSNGPLKSLQPLLRHNGLLERFDELVSVDDKATFKPDPATYAYLHERLGGDRKRTWVVSSNPFDVIGAKHAGLRAAWIKRGEDKVLDPWGVEPDLVVGDLVALAERLPGFE